MATRRSPDPRIVGVKFLGGLLYLFAASQGVAWATATPLVFVFPIVFFGTLACTALALTWITLWAQRKDSQLGQFTIGSFLFATVFLSLFLAAVRWLVSSILARGRHDPGDWTAAFLVVSAFSLAFFVVSIPILVMFAEGLVWIAAWTARRWPVKRTPQRRDGE